MKKRICSILLAVCLVITMFPITALSLEEDGSASTEQTIQYTVLGGSGGAPGERYGNIFDGNVDTKWCETLNGCLYVIFSTDSPVNVSGYNITTANDNASFNGRNPKNWTLYGSSAESNPGKNSDSWQEIHCVTDDYILQDVNYTTYHYAFEKAETAYKFFKLEISAVQDGTIMQMSEFSLINCDHTWCDPVTTDSTCTTAGDTRKTCSICNGVMYYDYTQPLGHVFDANDICMRCGCTRAIDISQGNVIIQDDENNSGKIKVLYGDGESILNIDSENIIVVTGSTSQYEIRVETAIPVTIKAMDLSIDRLYQQNAYALVLTGVNGSADVTLILEGTNTLEGGTEKAGITVGEGKMLTIEGSGTVTAVGRSGGAGIGGEYRQKCGTVIINSGTVIVEGKFDGADIGGGRNRNASGTAIITGGSVTAVNNKITCTAGIKLTDNENLEAYGELTIPTDLTIPAGKTLTVPEGVTITIPEGVTLINNGTIANFGTIINHGTFLGNTPKIGVKYLDEHGVEQSYVGVTEVTDGDTQWTAGWYVVNGNVTIDSPVTVNGDVHLILADGCNLTVNGNIEVNNGSGTLTVYGQSEGSGKLNANTNDKDAGIGGSAGNSSGTITINGGTITADSTSFGAAIGGGGTGDGTVIINGGTIIANSKYVGAAIGGGGASAGQSCGAGNVTINGGTIYATSNGFGAAIGGGGAQYQGVSGGDANVTVTGGTIYATSNIMGTAIGGGYGPAGSVVGNITYGGGIVFLDNDGTVYGNQTLTADMTIAKGQTLTVGEGKSLTVPQGITLTNNGTINNDGTINNNGTIENNGTINSNGTVYNNDTVTGTYYTVNFDLNGGNGSIATQCFFNVGTAKVVKPEAPTRDSYVFEGWYNGETKYDFTAVVTESMTLTANWVSSNVSTEAELKRILDLGGTFIRLANDVTLSSLLDLSDKLITLDLNGHTLKGNIKLADTSAAPQSILTLIDSDPAAGGVVNGNITLTRGNGSTSHLYANGGTITGQVSMPSYAGGIFCTSDTPTVFKGYVGNYGGIYGGLFYGNVNESCIKGKTVTFMNGSSRHALQVVTDGSKAVVPVEPTKSGYVFVGWYNGETKYNFNDSITESITLTAMWKCEDVSTPEKLNEAVNLDCLFVKLTNDITLSSPLGLSDKVITLDLNGHVLTGDINMADTSAGLKTILILIDSDPAATHTDTALPLGGVVNGSITMSLEDGGACILYGNGGAVMGTVSTGSMIEIYCTNDTPTAFMNDVGNNGAIYSGMFYGDVKKECIYANYKITFMDGSGRYALQLLDYGEKVVAPVEPTKDGCVFLGWYNGETKYTFGSTTRESITLVAKWKDITAPTGEIGIGTNKWTEILNDITFGLFFKDTQTVTITASDNIDEDVTIEYLLSNKGLTADELAAASFTAYTEAFSINPDNAYVIYAKLTDASGNVAYLSSDGIVLDGVVPVISGVEHGKTYCSAQTVTVTEKYVASVTVNGNPVSLDANNQFTLSATEGTQTIVATDKAGNVTSATVTVNDGHTPEADDGDCTTPICCAVCGEIVTPAKPHTPEEDDGDCTTQVVCSVCGTITTPAMSHDFSGEWKHDDAYHWHQCQNAGCNQTDEKVAIAPERIEATIANAAYLLDTTVKPKDITVTAYYSDGFSETVTTFTTDIDDIDMSTVGSKTITVSLTKNGGTCTDDITIHVIEDHHNYFNGVCTGCGSYEPPELKNGVYQIKNYANLYWFSALVNGTLTDGTPQNTSANAVLVNDITVNSIANTGNYLVWTPIGNSDNRYEGTFDGQGHKIIGLYFNDASADYVGLFGYLLYGTIRNVGVVGSYFNGKNSVGGVCGHSYGTIENCYNTSTANGVSNVGGIVGVNFGGEIRNCYNTGAISASNYGAGGIAGYNYYATIMNCYSSAAISAPADVGGICGASDHGTANNCYHNSKYFKGDSVGKSYSGTEENVSAKTATQFTSGEVAYLLSNGVTDGTQAWYQTLGTDGYPTLDNTHGTVYCNASYPGCVGAPGTPTYKYENVAGSTELPPHNFVDGICSICGAEQHIVIIEADMHAEGFVLGANTVSDCKAELNTAEMYVVIKNMNGDALSDSDLVGTGATITYYDRTTNAAVKTVTVVLYGDVNGDGLVGAADKDTVMLKAVGAAEIENVWFLQSADTNRDGVVDAFDAALINLQIANRYPIVQKPA